VVCGRASVPFDQDLMSLLIKGSEFGANRAFCARGRFKEVFELETCCVRRSRDGQAA
jgi:hypothetical protein